MTSLSVPPDTLHTAPGLEGPRYGILLNPHEAPPPRGRSADSRMKFARPAVRIIPVDTQAKPRRTPSDEVDGVTTPGVVSPKIRFAPLPNPHRPRSLSTGRNVHLRGSEDANGQRQYHIELQNMHQEGDYENALDDGEDDESEDDDMDGEDYSDEENARRKSWAVSMGSMGKSSWKGTKKLLGARPKEEEYGAPLKKSVSSGGVTTSSPFKWTGSGDSSMFGTSPKAPAHMPRRGSSASSASAASATAHRRGSSGDLVNPNAASKPARMLNGRMYGARRASEAAALEKQIREKAEPSFVEWGAGGAGTVAKSLGPVNKEDGDDGGGMAWVRRRREERERKAREEAEAAAAAAGAGEGDAAATAAPDPARNGSMADTTQFTGSPTSTTSHTERPASLSSSASSSSPVDGRTLGPHTPHEPASELHSPFAQFQGFGATSDPEKVRKASLAQDVAPGTKGAPSAAAEQHDSDHHVHAVSIPGSEYRRRHSDADDDNEEEEDDGDFDNDDEDEEELLAGMGGVCASAAGVEILSRHKD